MGNIWQVWVAGREEGGNYLMTNHYVQVAKASVVMIFAVPMPCAEQRCRFFIVDIYLKRRSGANRSVGECKWRAGCVWAPSYGYWVCGKFTPHWSQSTMFSGKCWVMLTLLWGGNTNAELTLKWFSCYRSRNPRIKCEGGLESKVG